MTFWTARTAFLHGAMPPDDENARIACAKANDPRDGQRKLIGKPCTFPPELMLQAANGIAIKIETLFLGGRENAVHDR